MVLVQVDSIDCLVHARDSGLLQRIAIAAIHSVCRVHTAVHSCTVLAEIHVLRGSCRNDHLLFCLSIAVSCCRIAAVVLRTALMTLVAVEACFRLGSIRDVAFGWFAERKPSREALAVLVLGRTLV